MLPSEDESQHLSVKYRSLASGEIRNFVDANNKERSYRATAAERLKNLAKDQNSFGSEADFLQMMQTEKKKPMHIQLQP
jgi:hypothetical protein